MFAKSRFGRIAIIVTLLTTAFASAKIVTTQEWVTLSTGRQALIEWGLGELVATGQAVPPTNATSAGQKQLLARRGAVLDAQRNLLETVEGVQVTSDSTMVNFMANDVVRTQVEGAVMGATVTSESWDPASEIYTVEMTMPLDSVRQIAMPPKTISYTPSIETPTGIVINLRGLGAVPSLTFDIYTVGGTLVTVSASGFYVSVSSTDDPVDVSEAVSDSRVADDPFVVRVEALAENRIDLIVDESTGQMLIQFLAERDFFGEGRILIVLD